MFFCFWEFSPGLKSLPNPCHHAKPVKLMSCYLQLASDRLSASRRSPVGGLAVRSGSLCLLCQPVVKDLAGEVRSHEVDVAELKPC